MDRAKSAGVVAAAHHILLVGEGQEELGVV
jgi:hypothetical protein